MEAGRLMASGFLDFSGFSTGNISTVASGTLSVTLAGAGDWTQTINTDAGATGGQTAVLARTATGTEPNVVTVDASSTASGTAIEVYSRFKVGSGPSTGYSVGPCLSASDGRCYSWYPVTATTWRLALIATNGGISSNIGSGAVSFTAPSAGTYFKARVGRDASGNVYGSVWLDGDSEPSTMLSGSNTTLTTINSGFNGQRHADAPMTYDVLGWGTAGDAAPTSGGGVTGQLLSMIANQGGF